MRLRPYRDNDWEHVRDFIRTSWRDDHPVCKKTLFDWQFGGFGNDNKKINSLLLWHDDEVIGMRGVIPGLYQVPVEKNKMCVVQGGHVEPRKPLLRLAFPLNGNLLQGLRTKLTY